MKTDKDYLRQLGNMLGDGVRRDQSNCLIGDLSKVKSSNHMISAGQPRLEGEGEQRSSDGCELPRRPRPVLDPDRLIFSVLDPDRLIFSKAPML